MSAASGAAPAHSGSDYWVDMLQGTRRLGAGFFVLPGLVLTARHCLPYRAADGDVVDVRCGDGKVIPGSVRLPRDGVDLALVELSHEPDLSVTLPNADRSERDEPWSNPYRPEPNFPFLSGEVDDPTVAFLGADDIQVEALQLSCRQALGDYSGYSGSPIERADRSDPALLGILVEQFPDRQDPERASEVLFAVTMLEVLRRFDYFGYGHLAKLLSPHPAARPVPAAAAERGPTDTSMSEQVSAAARFSEWVLPLVEGGYLNRDDVSVLLLQVAKDIVAGGGQGASS